MEIEIIATTTVKKRLAICDGLSPYINEHDKEPIWDGNIYVYLKDSNKNDDFIDRVPVQARGKKKTVSRKTRNLSYNVKVSDLKYFFNDGGVIYFVVAVGDGGQTTIFYQNLLPYDLNALLVNIGRKKTKAISLRILPDDNDAIRQLFFSFIEDRRRQATKIVLTEEQAKEAFRGGASLNFHIQPKKNHSNSIDIMKEATTQSFYLYIEIKNGIELPFGKVDERYSVMTQQPIDATVQVNGVQYYNNIAYGYENGKGFLCVGHSIKLPIAENTVMSECQNVKCTLNGTLSERITDSDFLLALTESSNVIIDSEKAFNLNINKPKDVVKLRQLNRYYKRIKVALNYFGVSTDLDMNNLTDMDQNNINELIRASEGGKTSFNEKDLPGSFFYNWKIGNISIRIRAKKEYDSEFYKISNAFADNAHVRLELTLSDGNIVIAEPWSLYLYMVADDFICSNVDFSRILNSIKAMKVSDRELAIRRTESRSIGANSMLLEIITAYDSQDTKDKRLLQFAEDIADIIITTDPVTIINRYQIIIRKRSFTNNEIANLVNLRQAREEKVYKCAISILLKEFEEAKMLLEELSFDERKQITDYPIYNLLK